MVTSSSLAHWSVPASASEGLIGGWRQRAAPLVVQVERQRMQYQPDTRWSAALRRYGAPRGAGLHIRSKSLWGEGEVALGFENVLFFFRIKAQAETLRVRFESVL